MQEFLAWVLEQEPGRICAAVEESLARLARVPRPTAVSDDKQRVVADADALRAHGRLPDTA